MAVLPHVRATAIVCALAFSLSLALAVGWSHVREPSPASLSAPVHAWVTDRDGESVFGLDQNLLLVRSVAIRAPIEIEARSDGGAWVVSSTNADPLGPHELLRLSAQGSILHQAQVGALLDLSCDELGRAMLVDFAAGAERVSLFDADAAVIWRRELTGALCCAARGTSLLVGFANGEIALHELNSDAPPLRSVFGGSISDVAAGPTRGSWWILDSHGYGRLALLDDSLGVSWSRGVGLHAIHIAPVLGVERVWIADTTQPRVRRFGANGVLEIDRADMPLGGLDRACAIAAGSALFTAPGALLRLDALGQNSPGQAGFDFLVDVSVVP